MKRLFTTFALAAIIIIAGCTDLDDVYRQLDEQKDKLAALEARLRTVEQLTSNVNSEITSIKALIDALNRKVSVVSYKELSDKSGYELTMSDGSKITLKHGAKGEKGEKGDQGKKGDQGDKGEDGIAPVINVKQHTDALLYWTINGEWLLDAYGKKVPAQGKDGEAGAPGANGITPLLRINAEFHWEMSLDNGKTWQLVKDANDNPIPAQGPKGEQGEPGNDGDADLTITESGDVIIIVYKGVTYTLQKGGGAPPPVYTITFTTTKKLIKGQKIKLTIDAADADRADVWIDLNNNGIKDDGEAVTTFEEFVEYTLGAQTVTVYGKVTELRCSSNNLTSLDVRHNTALTSLFCDDNHLTSLDVSENTALRQLLCAFNPLKALDVSHNTALTWLNCSGNELSALDVSNNTALTSLFCFNNQLTALNVSHNTALRNLTCYSNKISGDNMTALVNSLPTLKVGNKGSFQVISLTYSKEQNKCTTVQVGIATGKNWIVRDADNNPYPGS